MPQSQIEIRPQPGAQEDFLSTCADIAITGGKAGTGKTFGLLIEHSRHRANPRCGSVIFRRESPEIKSEGGLWDTSMEIYPLMGATPTESRLEWGWPSGATVRFCHMETEKDRLKWGGSQVPLISFDQLETFTWKQFNFMLSRNRSTCGVRPYMRGTCNPDPDSWLRRFLAWWIDEDTGLAIPARSGVVRYFIVQSNQVEWGSSKQDLRRRFGPEVQPLSFTFIPGHLEENLALVKSDPGYKPRLMALTETEQQRLLLGNWNARETAGTFYQKSWFKIRDLPPPESEIEWTIRYWDRAATEEPEGGFSLAIPATAGVKICRLTNGEYGILHSETLQADPLGVERAIVNMARQDQKSCMVGIEQDPAQAGKAEAMTHVRNLPGYEVILNTVHESKAARARPFSAQVRAGNVFVVRGPWNDRFLRNMENFDGTRKAPADEADACSGAFYLLSTIKRAGVW